jgi:hypothetical protein
MIKEKILYINVDSSAVNASLVRSRSNTTPVAYGSVVAGDTLQLVIVPINGDGTINSIAGDANYSLKVAIGGPGDGPLAMSTNFGISGSYGWTGSLNTDTGSLTTALGILDRVSSFFEVEITAGAAVADSGSRYTIAQLPMTIYNQVILNS